MTEETEKPQTPEDFIKAIYLKDNIRTNFGSGEPISGSFLDLRLDVEAWKIGEIVYEEKILDQAEITMWLDIFKTLREPPYNATIPEEYVEGLERHNIRKRNDEESIIPEWQLILRRMALAADIDPSDFFNKLGFSRQHNAKDCVPPKDILRRLKDLQKIHEIADSDIDSFEEAWKEAFFKATTMINQAMEKYGLETRDITRYGFIRADTFNHIVKPRRNQEKTSPDNLRSIARSFERARREPARKGFTLIEDTFIKALRSLADEREQALSINSTGR